MWSFVANVGCMVHTIHIQLIDATYRQHAFMHALQVYGMEGDNIGIHEEESHGHDPPFHTCTYALASHVYILVYKRTQAHTIPGSFVHKTSE